MSWINEDFEYPNDEMYAIVRHEEMKAEWQQWEEENERKNRLPAVIKVLIPIKDEIKRNTTTVRRAHQERL